MLKGKQDITDKRWSKVGFKRETEKARWKDEDEWEASIPSHLSEPAFLLLKFIFGLHFNHLSFSLFFILVGALNVLRH